MYQSFKIRSDKEHTIDQDNLKKAINVWNQLKETDWFKERPLNVQELYNNYPPWKFYTNKDNTTAYRVYGVLEQNDGTLRLATACGMMMMTNLTIGGHDPNDLIPVEKYTESAFEKLKMNPN